MTMRMVKIVKNKIMPFKSEAQRRFLRATKPALAKEFERKTLKLANMPKRAKPKVS